MQQELESCWKTFWWELRYSTGFGSAYLPTEASSYHSLSNCLSPLYSRDSWVALASTDCGLIKHRVCQVESWKVWSREWSQQATSTYWVEKQLWSFHVGRQRSQAASKSVWSGCLGICSHPFQCVCSRPAHTRATLYQDTQSPLVAVEFVSSYIPNLHNVS